MKNQVNENTNYFKSNNPIIQRKGICDPHVHVFDDTAYLYASHDNSIDNKDWLMSDWQIWASKDLINWEYQSTFKPEDTYIGKWDKCWAVDAAEKNGKYFYYFSKANIDTGVAVSDNPGYGFKDALGKPILPEGFTDSLQYDPTVFVDDNETQTPYLIWGCYHGSGYYIARLNDDMISFAEEPFNIKLEGAPVDDDKSFVHKYKGKYYLTWASNYAMADNIYGPYKYIGNIGVSIDHGSFFKLNGQWFNAFTIYDPTCFYRSTGICYIHYKENGEMLADQMICEYGVGHYDANWTKINAEWYMDISNAYKKMGPFNTFNIAGIQNGSYLYYPNVENISENSKLYFFGCCANPSGVTIEVREKDVDGPILGVCRIEGKQNWKGYCYTSNYCTLTTKGGNKDIYLVFKGEGEELYRLDWFKFA